MPLQPSSRMRKGCRPQKRLLPLAESTGRSSCHLCFAVHIAINSRHSIEVPVLLLMCPEPAMHTSWHCILTAAGSWEAQLQAPLLHVIVNSGVLLEAISSWQRRLNLQCCCCRSC